MNDVLLVALAFGAGGLLASAVAVCLMDAKANDYEAALDHMEETGLQIYYELTLERQKVERLEQQIASLQDETGIDADWWKNRDRQFPEAGQA